MPQEPDLLAAASRCYLRQPVARTTMADIAAEAGVSRATLYRRYPKHEDVFLAVLARESERLADDARKRLRGVDDPGERVVEGMLFCLRELPKRRLHAHLFAADSAGWSSRPALRSEALARISRSFLVPMLGEAVEAGTIDPDWVEDLSDWILRILVSYVAIPRQRNGTPQAMRRLLRRMLLPAVRAALEGEA